MKRMSLFAVSFLGVFLGLISAFSLTLPSSASAQQSAPASSASGEPMTPRQIAEMRADLLSARKEYEEAVAAYQDILKNEPRNAALMNKIGVAYESIGNNLLAERYYKKAIHVDGTFGMALNNLGTLEYSERRYGRAIKDYKKALDHIAAKAPIYSNLGYAYSANNDIPHALECFRKALALDPTIYQPHGPGGVLIQQRTAADPGTIFFLLAKAYAQAGDVDHTVQYLKLARDSGYKKLASAKKDPAFAAVIANHRVLDIIEVESPLVPEKSPPVSN